MDSGETGRNRYRVVWGPQRFYLSIGWKTLIAFALVLFVPMAGVLAVSAGSLRAALEEESFHMLDSNLRGGWRVLRERPQAVKALLELSARHPDIVAAVAQQDHRLLQALLREHAEQSPFVDLWLVLDDAEAVLGRRQGDPGGRVHTNGVASAAAERRQSVVSTERLHSATFVREHPVRHAGMQEEVLVQVIAVPVIARGDVPGVLVALVVLDEDAWLPNVMHDYLGVDGALLSTSARETRVVSVSRRPGNIWPQGLLVPGLLDQAVLAGAPYRDALDLNDRTTLVVAEPILNLQGQAVGALAVGVPLASVDSMVRENSWFIWGFTLLGLALALPIALLAYRDTMAPMRAIRQAMQRFASGHLDVRTDIRTKDEFEHLGQGFNRMAEAIAEHQQRMEGFNALTSLLIAQGEPEELLGRVLNEIIRLTCAETGVFYLVDRSGGETRPQLWPRVAYGADMTALESLQFGEGLVGEAARQQRTLVASPPLQEHPVVIHYGFAQVLPRELVAIPVLYQDEVLGVLLLASSVPFDFGQRNMLEYVSNQVAIFLENAFVHEEVRRLSMTDDLTGLYNRRHLLARLQEEFTRAQRYGTPLSVLLLDVDHFKAINDTLGHAAGDRVLQAVAQALRSNLRESDLCGRHGGEEFLVGLPSTGLHQALIVADKIRKAVAALDVPELNGRTVTVSVGVASGEASLEALLETADRRMYEAKHGGRNQVVGAA